jgi:uncharacterized protein YdaU (DUF1376 family)
MSAPASLPIFGDAYLADTQHLTLEEHGAYFKLLLCAWRTEACELPADDKRIATMLGVSAGKWGKLKPAVLAFWTRTETGWQQKRLSKERDYVETRRAAQSERAVGKWKPASDTGQRANAQKRSQRLSEARSKARHTDAQWASIVEACRNVCVKCHATGLPLVKDHIIPIYQGGSDGPDNLQPLCIRCNSSKASDATDYRLSVCKDLFERLPECLPLSPPPLVKEEPIANAMDGEPSQDANSTDDPIDLKALLFSTGKPYLTRNGVSLSNAGSILGKWRQSYGDGAVIDALALAQAEACSDPIPFITKLLEKRNGNATRLAATGVHQPQYRRDPAWEGLKRLHAELEG